MSKTIIPIKGMHCRSCEILIEDKLKELPGIQHIRVKYKINQALVYSKCSLDMVKARKKIFEAGYDIGADDAKSWISHDLYVWQDLAKCFVLLLALYFVASKFGLFNIKIGSVGNSSNLLVILLIGLTAGLSTCMALVGGLILGISARHSEKHPQASPIQKFRPHLFFNLGRILSYFILGGIIGLVGQAFQLNGPALGILTIIVGVVMLILGAQLTDAFPRLSSGGLTIPPSVAKFLGIKKHEQKEYSHASSALTGALTFFLPCGFTQAMQLYAMSTGNFFSGALIMGTFALGTAPGLLGIGGLTSILKGALAKKFFKFTGLLVMFLAIFNISNGYRLTGWQNVFAKLGNQSTEQDTSAKVENNAQIVNMTQLVSGYKPNKFTIKKDIPVKWIIDSKDSGSCAASISMPKKNIRKNLKPGENIIEFTANEAGDLTFTCAMGMYSGKFTVVDDNETPGNNVQSPSEKSEDSSAAPSATPAIIGPQPPTKNNAPFEPEISQPTSDETQVIKATYDPEASKNTSDISPSEFTVKAGKPVRLEIDPKADGQGCMGTITIPGLVDDPVLLEKGQLIKFEFTPDQGAYNITCGMGVPRGRIIAL